LAILTAVEVIEVDQDPDCVQGSLARSRAGGEVWIKPLSDDSFALVFINTVKEPQNITIMMDGSSYTDFWPARLSGGYVRDLWTRQNLGYFSGWFTALVPGQDARIFKISQTELQNNSTESIYPSSLCPTTFESTPTTFESKPPTFGSTSSPKECVSNNSNVFNNVYVLITLLLLFCW